MPTQRALNVLAYAHSTVSGGGETLEDMREFIKAKLGPLLELDELAFLEEALSDASRLHKWGWMLAACADVLTECGVRLSQPHRAATRQRSYGRSFSQRRRPDTGPPHQVFT